MSDANDKPDNTNNTKPDNSTAANVNNNSSANTEGETWLRNELAKTRDEAANRRIEARTANEQLETVRGQVTSLTAAKDEATTRATKAEGDLQKLKIAMKAGVQGDKAIEFAELLQGNTEDEIIEHANKIIGVTNAGNNDRATDHSQARGNNSGKPTPNTPQAEFAEMFGNLPIFRK